MERAQKMLFEAAVEGRVSSLLALLQSDPLILDRVIVNCYNETPLHVAAILGHTEFVKKILSKKPELAPELNSQGSSALHLASAKGYVEIVKALLLISPDTCLARDENGRNPLHLAAMKGRIEVLKELVRAKLCATRATVNRGETILHLCVQCNQLEALEYLVGTGLTDDNNKNELVNAKDDDGNTILHLAVAEKQIKTVNFLLARTAIDVNALNAYGFTAMDILGHSRRDIKDMDIAESLRSAEAFRAKDRQSSDAQGRSIRTNDQTSINSGKKNNNTEYRLKPEGGNWLPKKKEALMIVASLIATMAFQVGVNPPGGVWQDNTNSSNDTDSHRAEFSTVGQNNPIFYSCSRIANNRGLIASASNGRDSHRAGFSIMAQNNPIFYGCFLMANTTGFVASLSIILLLVSGLPLRRSFFMWILMVIMWVAITAMSSTYVISISALTPDETYTILEVIGFVILAWAGLMAILLLGHTIRLLVHIIRLVARIIKKLIKMVGKKRRTSSNSVIMNRV